MNDDKMYDLLVEAHDLVFQVVYQPEEVGDEHAQKQSLMRVQTILGSVTDVLYRKWEEARRG